MPIYTLQGPDGRTYKVEGPAGATAEQLGSFIQSQPATPAPQKERPDDMGTIFKNLAAGAVRGAGSIGSTLVAPYDIYQDYKAGKGLSLESNQERRKKIDEGLTSLVGSDPESGAYRFGKVGAEIAGTAGVPGALAKSAQAAKFSPGLVEALRTVGTTSAAGLPTRIAGGAIAGGATAGLVDPEDAKVGAIIGGGIPAAAGTAKALSAALRKGLGTTTGVGEEALSQAYQAGKAGGKQAESFVENMRGNANIDDVLGAVRKNLDAMNAEKQAAYRSGMVNIKNDKSVLSFDEIDNAIKNAGDIVNFKGQVKNPEAANALSKIREKIVEWKGLNPAEFHTPEGLDALKQSVSGILESIPYEQKTARNAVGKVYDSIRGTINQQAPEYSRVMKDYSEASDLMREIQQSLVGGNKATAESGMRKLQSLMRNNVNTSYGYRTQLAKELENAGGEQIMAPLAGQALSDWTPRGIQRATAGTGALALGATGNIPAAAVTAAMSSPRLMGELYYGAGKVSGSKLAQLLRQSAESGERAAPVLANPLNETLRSGK